MVRAFGDVGMGLRQIRMTMSEFQAAEVIHEGHASNSDAQTSTRSFIYDNPQKAAVAPLTAGGSL